MVIRHLASHVYASFLMTTTMVDERVQVCVMIKAKEVFFSFLTILFYAGFVCIESGTTYVKLCFFWSADSFCVKLRQISKRKYPRHEYMFVSFQISLRVKNEFEEDMIIKQESCNLHKYKIRVTRTIIKQIRITQAYTFIYWGNSESFHLLCRN